MFCRCFCPGTLSEIKKDISIIYNDKKFKLKEVVIKKCHNNACRDGTIPKETWEYITSTIGHTPEDGIESYRLAKIIFEAFRSQP